MNFDDIERILELVREHDLAEFELERDGLKVRVRKATAHVEPATVQHSAVPSLPTRAGGVPAAPSPLALPEAPILAATSPEYDAEVELAVVKSPIVGTFYRSADPGASPFVDIGEYVKKDQVLCIIEAMKLMNEITSEYEGEIVSIYVENGKPVQYGERLFAIKTS